MTYKMAYQNEISKKRRKELFKDVKWIVIDEAHLMTNRSRGPTLESFVYIVNRFCRDKRLVLLSATVGNPHKFAKHFSCDLVFAPPEERPIHLKKTVWPSSRSLKKDQKLQQISTLIMKILHKECKAIEDGSKIPSTLVFCNSRAMTQKLHQIFSSDSRIPAIKAEYHHAGRSKKQRDRVESLFRKNELNLV